MPRVMTREQLDTMQCQHPNCTHTDHSNVFFFHARCHMEADCEVSYDRNFGVMKIDCGECGQNIALVQIA